MKIFHTLLEGCLGAITIMAMFVLALFDIATGGIFDS